MNVDGAIQRVQRLIAAEKQMADDERARAAADNQRAAASIHNRDSASYSAAARTHLRAAQLHDDAALLQATHRDHLIALSDRANRSARPLT